MTRIDLIKENKITSSIIDLIKETKAISSIHEAKDFLAKLKAVDAQTYDYLHDEIIAQIDPSKDVSTSNHNPPPLIAASTTFDGSICAIISSCK